jgi:hypothetical protein
MRARHELAGSMAPKASHAFKALSNCGAAHDASAQLEEWIVMNEGKVRAMADLRVLRDSKQWKRRLRAIPGEKPLIEQATYLRRSFGNSAQVREYNARLTVR